MIKRIFLITVLVLFTPLSGVTETRSPKSPYEKIHLESLSIDDGLSESEVKTIIQDRKGFMWFGTANGLNRFDGYHITVYSHDPQNPRSISHNLVYFLHEDRSGNIWVGTANGPNKYNPTTDTFTHLLHDPQNPHTISHPHIISFLEDNNGTPWIGTPKGLNRFDKIQQSFTRFINHPETPHSLSANYITTIHHDKTGTLWVGTLNGLNRTGMLPDPICTARRISDASDLISNRYREPDTPFKRFIYNPDAGDTTQVRNESILTIFEDRHGTIWVGTPGGLYRYNREKETFTHFSYTPGAPDSLSDNDIQQLFEDGNGTIWAATAKGLNRFNKTTGTFTRFLQAPPASTGNAGLTFPYIHEDKKGRLWVGTVDSLNRFDNETGNFKRFVHGFTDMDGSGIVPILNIQEDRLGGLWLELRNAGLCRFDPETGTFSRFMSDSNAPLSFPYNRPLLPMKEDRSGVLWIGTFGGGAKKFDPWKRQFIHIRRDPLDADSLSNNMVYGICEDSKGDIWIGTYGDGAERLDPKTGGFSRYRRDPANPRSLSNNKVAVIKEDQYGVIWLGTVFGLNRFNAKTGDFTRYLHRPKGPHSLSGNHVTTMEEDAEGNLWVGTETGLNGFRRESGDFIRFLPRPDDTASISNDHIRSIHGGNKGYLWVGTLNGLNKLDYKTNSFTRFQNRPGDPSSLSDNYVYSIFEDKEGIVWLGTGGGLNRFDPVSHRFTSWRKKDGLPTDTVYGILEDSSSNLWLSASILSKFNPATATFTNYDVYNGNRKNYFAEGAYAKGKSGRFYFGGLNGVTLFFPGNVKPNPYVPPVVITDFRVFNRSVSPGKREKGHPLLAKTITETREIQLSHKHNSFSFEFAALHFSRPDMNRYAYKMDGYDEDWFQAGTRRFVTYTNLPPGDFVFRVKAANSDNVWNERGTAIKIRITPPWWQTPWAYALYLIVITSVIFAASRMQRSIVEKKERHKAHITEVELRAQAAELQAKAAEAESRLARAESLRKSHELEEARKLQLSMLPDKLPDTPDFDIAVHMNTATEVGGDYYDFDPGENGTLTVLVGDATGHGLKAGTMVSIIKTLFTSRWSHLDIKHFFKDCAETIKKMRLGNLHMALTLLQVKNNTMTVSSAGMPPVLIYRPAKKTMKKIVIKRPPLGAIKNINYPCKRLTLQEGDTVLLLSDGLAESFNRRGEMFGYSRVETCFKEIAEKTPEEIISHLVKAADQWRDGAPPEDDITFVVIKVKKHPRGNKRSTEKRNNQKLENRPL